MKSKVIFAYRARAARALIALRRLVSDDPAVRNRERALLAAIKGLA